MATYIKVPIVLNESPAIRVSPLTPHNLNTIDAIITKGKAAKALKQKQLEKKAAALREMEAVMISLLESPEGLTKDEILADTNAMTLSAALSRIKAYLRHTNLYTLSKKKKGKTALYFLDPIR